MPLSLRRSLPTLFYLFVEVSEYDLEARFYGVYVAARGE